MNASDDTIAAIATAAGEAGISIVRVSGAKSLEIADRIFCCAGDPPSQRKGGTFVYGKISGVTPDCGAKAIDIDEVLLLIFRAPHSYTREDVVEIQGHGGLVSAQRILRRLFDLGARSAEPGEFTKRAFLNGRLDLTQAEAVMDLVRASSERAASAAMEQLGGALTRWSITTYAKLVSVIAGVEAALDFPDDEMPPILVPESLRGVEEILDDLKGMLATWGEGHILRDGALTVISGKPNVGKSTLFNALLGHDRAIVTNQPGTTRDTIEEGLLINGILLHLVDTAGLRETSCDIEHQGIARARLQMKKADLHVHVLDASQPISVEDQAELDRLPPDKTIVVLNKIDLGALIKPADIQEHTVIPVCLLKTQDVNNLKITLAGKLMKHVHGPVRSVISERHRQIIVTTTHSVSEARLLLSTGKEDVLVPAASLLRSAAEALATLTGQKYYDDLLDLVFSRFCVGK